MSVQTLLEVIYESVDRFLRREGYSYIRRELPFRENRISVYGCNKKRKRTVAIVICLEDWMSAFKLAYAFQECANLVYVAAPKGVIGRLDRTIFVDSKIGLLCVRSQTWCVEELKPSDSGRVSREVRDAYLKLLTGVDTTEMIYNVPVIYLDKNDEIGVTIASASVGGQHSLETNVVQGEYSTELNTPEPQYADPDFNLDKQPVSEEKKMHSQEEIQSVFEALDLGTAEKRQSFLDMTKTPATVEEKKISSKVIRRRKKSEKSEGGES